MGLTLNPLRLLRWTLIAWIVAVALTAYLPKVLPVPQTMRLPFLTTVVQGALLWASYSAISKGSAGGRVFLTILAGVQLIVGFVDVALYVRVPFTLAMSILAIAIRGATISLVNEAQIRSIRPSPPIPSPTVPEPGHEWRPHGQLDGWIRCSTCGKVQASPGEVALINRK